jgi:8-oxo-dGTP pyrophosphatase MutT (NUDIX family)
MSDAVAAVIRLDDGRFLMQLRDARPDIWYPASWGCFGGAVDEGELPLDALRRELREELEYEVVKTTPVSTLEFDLRPVGLGKYYRAYYLIEMSAQERARLVLHEGERMDAFTYEELRSGMPVTPYDAFAVHLYFARACGVLGDVR